jgi:hypothetical protein
MPGGYLIGFLIERWQSSGAVLELASRVVPFPYWEQKQNPVIEVRTIKMHLGMKNLVR